MTDRYRIDKNEEEKREEKKAKALDESALYRISDSRSRPDRLLRGFHSRLKRISVQQQLYCMH